MKKKIVNMVLSAAVITTMVFSVTACGSKAEDTGAEVQSQAEVQSEAGEEKVSTAAESTEAGDENASTAADSADASELPSLEEWVSSEEAVASVDYYNQILAGSGMQVAFNAEGDTFIFTLTFDEVIDLGDEEATRAAMEAQADEMSASVTELRDELLKTTSNTNIVLRFEYINGDGSEIFSKEF